MLHLMIRGVRNRAKFSLSIVPMPVLALVGLVLLAVGCATPVGVNTVGPAGRLSPPDRKRPLGGRAL